jgi:hypothetical protein
MFMIDDDSLMYPNCAERIMAVYEQDTRGQIHGISARSAASPPQPAGEKEQKNTQSDDQPNEPKGFKQPSYKQFFRHLLKSDEIVIPYDEEFPRHPLPEPIASNPNVIPVNTMGGFLMTQRRSAALNTPFERLLQFYAAEEDTDQTLRLARGGSLALVLNAFLFHAKASGGRLSVYTVNVLKCMNISVLHRINSTNLQLSRQRIKASFRHRLFVEFAKDVENFAWTFPRLRGWLHGMKMVKHVLNKNPDDLREWYPGVQRELLDRNPS